MERLLGPGFRLGYEGNAFLDLDFSLDYKGNAFLNLDFMKGRLPELRFQLGGHLSEPGF
ncbi:8217_t:CDS:2 [Funneliformis geosporum]|nr:8217_t:CDS:2 [Funneliformis geosporum]